METGQGVSFFQSLEPILNQSFFHSLIPGTLIPPSPPLPLPEIEKKFLHLQSILLDLRGQGLGSGQDPVSPACLHTCTCTPPSPVIFFSHASPVSLLPSLSTSNSEGNHVKSHRAKALGFLFSRRQKNPSPYLPPTAYNGHAFPGIGVASGEGGGSGTMPMPFGLHTTHQSGGSSSSTPPPPSLSISASFLPKHCTFCIFNGIQDLQTFSTSLGDWVVGWGWD